MDLFLKSHPAWKHINKSIVYCQRWCFSLPEYSIIRMTEQVFIKVFIYELTRTECADPFTHLIKYPPCTPWRHTGKVTALLCLFLNSALYGGLWSVSSLGRFTSRKKRQPHSLNRRLGGPQRQYGRFGEGFCRDSNFDLPAPSLINTLTTLPRQFLGSLRYDCLLQGALHTKRNWETQLLLPLLPVNQTFSMGVAKRFRGRYLVNCVTTLVDYHNRHFVLDSNNRNTFTHNATTCTEATAVILNVYCQFNNTQFI